MNITECKQCGGENLEIRRTVLSNNTDQYVWQCMNCGEKCSSALKYDFVRQKLGSLEAADNFDEYLQETKRRAKWEKRQQAFEQQLLDFQVERAAESELWWAQYNEYLTTEKWRDKRRRVLERDNYECQACLKRPATQVHHLTYARVFNEPLFDLVSVCTICHEGLHEHMREGKNEL